MVNSSTTFEQICENLPYIHTRPHKLADGTIKQYRTVRITQGKGAPRIKLKRKWGTEAFLDEYNRAVKALSTQRVEPIRDTPIRDTPIRDRKLPEGNYKKTLGYLWNEFQTSEQWHRYAKKTKQGKIRRLRRIMEDSRFIEWHTLTRRDIKIVLAKQQEGSAGIRDGREARNQLLKDLSAIFRWAIHSEIAPDYFVNPCSNISKFKPEKGAQVGARPWTDAEIKQFLAHWPLGTVEHLYMQILNSFGPRISDARVLNKSNFSALGGDNKNWIIEFTTIKTGVDIKVPLSKEVLKALQACPSDNSEVLWTLGSHKKVKRPFKSVQTLDKWFRRAIADANLPKGLSSHGVRKSCATRLAEHSTEYQLMAIFGWKKPDEARPYIEKANKLKQARIAMEQGTIVQDFDEKIVQDLKTYINQGLMSKLASPTGENM